MVRMPPAHHAALAILLQAHLAARSVNRSPTEFACQLASLQRSGVGESELRLLVSKGLAVHLTELTAQNDGERCFRPAANLRFSEASSFLLTEEGLAWAAGSSSVTSPGGAGAQAIKPFYDQQRRTLFFGKRVVKRFRVPAVNQELILRAFEEEGWPPQIFDPLPQTPGIDPKKRLHDAIYRLNIHQECALLAFAGDGTSNGLLWRATDVGSTLD